MPVFAFEFSDFLESPFPPDFTLVVLRPNEINRLQQFDFAFRETRPFAARVPLFPFHPHLVDPNPERMVFGKLLGDVGCSLYMYRMHDMNINIDIDGNVMCSKRKVAM